jgi:hypothetical protein
VFPSLPPIAKYRMLVEHSFNIAPSKEDGTHFFHSTYNTHPPMQVEFRKDPKKCIHVKLLLFV